MQVLIQLFWEGPKSLHFNKLPGDADAAGPWIMTWVSRIQVAQGSARMCLWIFADTTEKHGLISIFNSFHLCPQQLPTRLGQKLSFIQRLLQSQREPDTPEAGREFHALIAKETSPAFKDGWKRKHNMWLHSVLKSSPRVNHGVTDMTQGTHGWNMALDSSYSSSSQAATQKVARCPLALRGQRTHLWSQSPAQEDSNQHVLGEHSRHLCKFPLANSSVWSTFSLIQFLFDTQ